jgi:hypothetical protein
LEKKDIGSLIEKGRLLQVAFDREDHGDRAEYHGWVAGELDISTSQEARYRNVFAFSEISQTGKFGERIKIADLNISRTALYELANAYPPGIVAEVLRMASTSPVTLAQVNTIFDEYRDACRAAAAAEVSSMTIPSMSASPRPKTAPGTSRTLRSMLMMLSLSPMLIMLTSPRLMNHRRPTNYPWRWRRLPITARSRRCGGRQSS